MHTPVRPVAWAEPVRPGAGPRVPGALLVTDQDVADLLGVEQRVVGGQHGPAGNAEDHVDADPLEGEYERLRASDTDRGGVVRPRRGRGLRRAARLRAGRLDGAGLDGAARLGAAAWLGRG